MCAHSQEIDSVYAQASATFARGEYQQAILECKRIQYFNAQYKADSVHALMAHSYFALGEYEQALFFYSKVEHAYMLKKASCYILTEQYELAQSELYTYTPTDSEPITDYYMLQACLYLQLHTIDSSYYYAQKLFDYTQDSSLLRLFENFSLLQKKSSQSLIVPQIASAIVPGLGLVLTGHTSQGLRAFAVVGGFALAFTGTAYSYSLFDACISFAPWLLRYYVGQIKKVKDLHQLHIEEIRYDIFMNLMDSYQSLHSEDKQ